MLRPSGLGTTGIWFLRVALASSIANRDFVTLCNFAVNQKQAGEASPEKCASWESELAAPRGDCAVSSSGLLPEMRSFWLILGRFMPVAAASG